MANVAFDTLAFSDRLQKSGFSREQADAMAHANAEAFAEAFKDIVIAQQLATKRDIAEVKREVAEVKREIVEKTGETKHEILKWMVTAMLAQTALLVGIIAFLR